MRTFLAVVHEKLLIILQSQTYDTLTLTPAYLASCPRRKEAPAGHELIGDYWKVVRAAPGADDAFIDGLNEVYSNFYVLL